MNPQGMMQFMAALNTFRTNHPKFAEFIGKFLKSISFLLWKKPEKPMR